MLNIFLQSEDDKWQLTLKAPKRNKVGSNPTEKMRRRMVEAMIARIPWGWGKMKTKPRENSITIHSRADRCGFSVPKKE